MKCPHCGYQTGVYLNEQGQYDKAEEEYGSFFKSSLEQPALKRGNIYRDNAEEAIMCGCPRCMKTFIEVE